MKISDGKADKITVGLTSKNRPTMNKIMEADIFPDQISAAKFALALAVKSDVDFGSVEGADTKWNMGSFDKDGELKTLIATIYPEVENPNRMIEYLINRGFEIIRQNIEKFGIDYIYNLIIEEGYY